MLVIVTVFAERLVQTIRNSRHVPVATVRVPVVVIPVLVTRVAVPELALITRRTYPEFTTNAVPIAAMIAAAVGIVREGVEPPVELWITLPAFATATIGAVSVWVVPLSGVPINWVGIFARYAANCATETA